MVDEEVVLNIIGTPVHQVMHFRESTRAAEIVSKTQPISINAMLALKYPEPILKPSSLLGFFSKTEIRETEKDFLHYTFLSNCATGRN